MRTKEQLFGSICQIHADCYRLCKQAFGRYFPNAGNVAVFCHSDEEYEHLAKIAEELTEPSGNPDQKYFQLREPIVIPAADGTPEAVYTHLYIRKPDTSPYGHFTGDIDFFLEPDEYSKLKYSLLHGNAVKGAEAYDDRPGWDMIQLSDPNVGAVAYVSTRSMAEKARVRF